MFTNRRAVISVWHAKGGSAKSLTSYCLSAYLSTKYQTLLLDMDPPATASNAFLSEPPIYNSFHVATGEVTIEKALCAPANDAYCNLKVVAGSSRLIHLEQHTAGDLERHYRLRDQLEAYCDFEFTVIDTPPLANINTISSLVASTHIICPVLVEPSAFEQVAAFEHVFHQVKRRMNPDLRLLGFVPSRVDTRNRLDCEIAESLQRDFAEHCFAPVRSSVRWREMMSQSVPPWMVGLPDYLNLTNEILRRLNHEQIQKP